MQTIKIRFLQSVVGMLLLANLGMTARMSAGQPPAKPGKTSSYTVKAKITAYCGIDNGRPCKICCGPKARGVTSTGRSAKRPGLAVDPAMIPYGSIVTIPGIGYRVADDTGSAMRADGDAGVYHIDVRMQTHAAARRYGVQYKEITINEPQG